MTGACSRLRRAAAGLRDELRYQLALAWELVRDASGLLAVRGGLVRRSAAAWLRGLEPGAALAVLEGDEEPAWLELLGATCRRAGRRADAVRLLLRALALDPERVSALRVLAACGVDRPPGGLFPAAFFHHHLGLGDHILCNALVRHFADSHGTLGLFVRRRYLESVRFMYRDAPAIRLFAVRDDREVGAFLHDWPQARCIRLGFEALDLSSSSFAEDFYRQAGLDYTNRWHGTVRRDPGREEFLFRSLIGDSGPYLFVHDDPGRGYVIDPARLPAGVPVVRPRPGLTNNIFDYGLVLERAQEIHCMDSSFRHVVDTLGLTGPRLFLHLYAKGVDVPSRLPWTVLT